MLNFMYHIPTKVFFGKGEIAKLPEAIKEYGSRVLLVSYKKRCDAEIAICNEAITLLGKANIPVWEFFGVDPNPSIKSVRLGADICRENNIDVVLAVGGGSAIDCSKGIAAAACYDGDPWELVLDNNKVTRALSIGAIATIAAAGSEMDHTAVISNEETNDKLHLFSDLVFPSFAIMDPTYTFSVPRFQTCCGLADIMCHSMEPYFGNTPDTYVQNRMAESMMKTVIHYTDRVLADPCDYEARANIMWTSALCINSMLAHGKVLQWSTHLIEHTASAYFDIPHGAGVAVILPVWLDYILDEETVGTFIDYAENVWNVPKGGEPFKTARAGIEALRKYYFETLGLPRSLKELGVTEDKLEAMANGAFMEGPIEGAISGTKLLYKEDVLKILNAAYKGN